jgi:tetratricopeptide (TPR) repeat protein
MNKQARVLLSFISSSESVNILALQDTSAQHSYYQRLIYPLLLRGKHTVEGFDSLGRQLANIAQHAYLIRQIETINQTSQLMLALPISKELKAVANYYQAICAKRKGDFDGARRLLEGVVESAPQQYKARALLTIGATYFDSGEVESALPFYLAAGQASRKYDLLTLAQSQLEIAVIRSIHNDHKKALNDLEHLFPIVRELSKHYPVFYYSFLNSLAVELGEVGRVNEARRVCQLTLASPFAPAYPEFAETRDELEAKRTSATPSVVAVSIKLEPQAQPAHKVNRVCSVASIQPARETDFFQTSIAVAVTAIARPETTASILDRVRYSIIARGPPACC